VSVIFNILVANVYGVNHGKLSYRLRGKGKRFSGHRTRKIMLPRRFLHGGFVICSNLVGPCVDFYKAATLWNDIELRV
jgi:hypothetical protein